MASKDKKVAATSGRSLAAVLGVGESTGREYLSRADWPVGRKPPWTVADVAKINAWRKVLQEDRAGAVAPGGSDDQLAAAKVNLGVKLERMKLTRVQRLKLEGALVDKSLLERALDGLARMFVAEIEELERSLPFELAGRDPANIENILRSRFRASRQRLAAQTVIELQQVEQKLAVEGASKARGRPARGR